MDRKPEHLKGQEKGQSQTNQIGQSLTSSCGRLSCPSLQTRPLPQGATCAVVLVHELMLFPLGSTPHTIMEGGEAIGDRKSPSLQTLKVEARGCLGPARACTPTHAHTRHFKSSSHKIADNVNVEWSVTSHH